MISLGTEKLRKYGVILGSCLLMACMMPVSVLAASQSDREQSEQTTSVVAEDLSVEVLTAQKTGSGVYQGCSWVLDENGKLTVRSVDKNSNLSNDPWVEYKDYILEVDIDVPYSSHLYEMFYKFDKLTKAKVKIDKGVGSASRMFACGKYVNDTYYSNLEEVDLYQFNTSGVTSMAYMFEHDVSLTKLDLSGLDTSKVTTMAGMFYGCYALEDLNISNFKTGEVTSMSGMFEYCYKLKQIQMAGFDTHNLEYTSYMFYSCYAVESINLENWDVTNLSNAYDMFCGCSNLTKLNLKGWNTQSLRSCNEMFYGCSSLKELDLSGLNTSHVTDMGGMFSGCRELKKLNISGFNTSKVNNMFAMFRSCSALTTLDLRSFDVSNVKNMDEMFAYCKALKKIQLGKFDTGKVRKMDEMFNGCESLTTIPTEKFDTSHVESMDGMFASCKSLKTINLKNFNTSCLKTMYRMFYDCESLTTLDLSSFDLSLLIADHADPTTNYSYYYYGIISNCYKLTTIRSPRNLKKHCSLSKGNGLYWCRDDSYEKIEEFPQKLSKSITLHMQESGNSFVDVRKPGWQYDAASYVYNKNIMSGVGTTKEKLVLFNGDVAMTRAQFVQTLYNYAKPKDVKYDKNKFSDVAKGKWYTNAIMWAADQGIVSGVAKNKFGVDNKITRQDMVTILYKFAKKKGTKYIAGAKKITSFTDYKKVSDYAVTPMKWATGNKIINGVPVSDKKYKLNPTGNATRVECAAIIKNFVTFVNGVK